MSFCELVNQELAKLLNALSHPDRIFIIEELYQGEREVKALQAKLEISHSRVSQHLSLLRAHHIVTERRQGRHVLYRLVDPELSFWLMNALKFIEFRLQHSDEILNAVESARQVWNHEEAETPEEKPEPENLIYITGRSKARKRGTPESF